MSTYFKQLTMVMFAILTITLAGCGSSDEQQEVAVETPLWCKSPETINDAGTACELVLTACNYPEVANEIGLCEMDTNKWIDGSNGIDMPAPEYNPGANEVVLYYNLKSGDFTDWGLHAWNNPDCNSYADFDRPEGGTDWTAPIQPTGIDANFGAYWVMNLIETPNCANFIPHNLETDTQTSDLVAELGSIDVNPTGSFFVLEGNEDFIFPYPRTFASLEVPGGATLTCEAPLVLNETGDACIEDPTQLETFNPDETTLYLKGSFNEWANNDDYLFSYANNIYTAVISLDAADSPYEFKVADANWSEATSFGAMSGEEVLIINEGKTLTVTEGENISFTVNENANYQFTFDATDPELPVLTVAPVTYNKVMYVKGSMNDWSNSDSLTYLGDNQYSVQLSLAAAEYEFKIADANWSETTNFGAAEGDETLALEQTKTLVFGEGIAQNIKLTIETAGTYTFELDATTPDSPILHVVNAVPFGSHTLYLKGSMNGWSSEEGFDFTYADNHYQLAVSLEAGSHEFKIADPDWSDGAIIGAVEGDGPLVVGEARTLTLPGDNLVLEVTETTLFKFDLDATDKSAPILTVSEYAPYSARTLYLKGSMNSWSTDENYAFTSTGTQFNLETNLTAGSYEFKIASDGWEDDSTLGAVAGDGALILAEARILTLPGDGNLILDITSDNDYVFSLDASQSDSPVLTVTAKSTSGELADPVVIAQENQLVIFYNRADNNYTDWILHLWNNETCDAFADFASDGGTDWNTGMAQTGIDPNYGAYWVIDLKTPRSDCANFIVHKGDEKDLGGIDHQADLTGDRMIWTLSGIPELYYSRTLFPEGVFIKDTAAHWVNAETVFWQVAGSDIAKVRLYSSNENELGFDNVNGIAGDNFVEFDINTTADLANTLGMPRYTNLTAFSLTNANIEKTKDMLKGKLLAIAYHTDMSLAAATYVQTPRVLDALYTSAANDANEAKLGLNYAGDEIITTLWAPTAQSVILNIYNADKTLNASHAMTLNSGSGVWSFTTDKSVDRLFYRFELSLYHMQNLSFETLETTDPYSVSLSTNGEYSQFVNLNDADLKPENWESHIIPVIADVEDAIIYEGHIRDFSIRDESTKVENRGKYLAFTETNSVPVNHLKTLAEAGLTHFQMLPANDIASIDEDLSNRVNLTDTVADLCAKNSSAPVCGVEDNTASLQSVFESYDPTSDNAQALTQAMRGLDSFNWGYDPKHFSTPDGSYASNPDGVSRILEMRAMNQALHEMGLRVVLDVVYNHTNSSGLWDQSVLDKVVPGYYHRRDLTTGSVETSTCCQDTAPEHTMMDKLMVDSLLIWAEHYKFDGFRFDIMSNNSVESILAARTAVQQIDPDNYFYGEGWTRSDRGYTQAQQNNMAGTGVGTFNDRPRDIIRSASLFKDSGSLQDMDIIRLGLAGTLAEYQLQDKNGIVKQGKDFSQPAYAQNPADIINYVSKHDNETLWDQLQYGLPADFSIDSRVRAQNITASLPLVSQGIPFFQFGGDLLRSKSMDRNTYDAGDWFNLVDFTKTSNNWHVGLPLAEDNQGKWDLMSALIANPETQANSAHISFASDIFNEFVAIRSTSKLFRLTSNQDVIDRLGFHNTGSDQTQGLIVMSIDDGIGLVDLDSTVDAIVVVVNGTNEEKSHTIATATGFELHPVQQASSDINVQSANFEQGENQGSFTVPAQTMAVFIKPQSAEQGSGLAADITQNQEDIPPFGDTEIYLRGTMNNWGNDGLTEADNFIYDGNGKYTANYELTAGTYSFKIADENWSVVNLGFDQITFTASSIQGENDGGNIAITIADEANYQFSLDASGSTSVLTVSNKSPTVDCTALVDSSDPTPFDIAGGGELYVKGNHSGWGAEEAYRLRYKGNNQYQAVANFDGSFQFKLASDDGSWTTQLWAQAADSTDIETQNLELGISYAVAYSNAGTDNNQADLVSGQYSVLLTLNEANPESGFNVGSMLLQQCQL